METDPKELEKIDASASDEKKPYPGSLTVADLLSAFG